MTTKFSIAKALKLPPLCKGSLVGLPVPYLHGEPPRLSCLASWVDEAAGLAIHESFDLNVDPALPGWSGNSSDEGINLRVTVEQLGVPQTYTATIILRDHGEEVDDASWHNVEIAKGPPFQLPAQFHHYPPADSYDSVTLLD